MHCPNAFIVKSNIGSIYDVLLFLFKFTAKQTEVHSFCVFQMLNENTVLGSLGQFNPG